MMEQLKEKMKWVAAAMWSHRASYAGLALAYGAGCVGVIDKGTVAQVATAIYVAMVVQTH